MAPAAKSKSAPGNGTTSKGKQSKGNGGAAQGDSSGTTTPAVNGKAASAAAEELEKSAEGSRGRPDKATYDAEQNKLRAEIEVKQTEKNKLDEQIEALKSGGPGGDKKKALYDELNELTSNNKTSRSNIFDQIKVKKESLEKKKKDVHAAKGKIPYRNVQELDAHLKHLEKQVESGTMKLAEEKRALAEISSSKRLRKNLEAFQADQDAIDKDQAALDELRSLLDDPSLKAAHDRAEAIRAEIAQIKKDSGEFADSRNKLFDKRTELKGEIDELYRRKRESVQMYKDANDRYWAKVREEQARRNERIRAQRQADEDAKKKEVALRLREEAEAPAFQEQIEDCQTLIDFLSGKGSGIKEVAPSVSKAVLTGVPELELRRVETGPAKGFTTSKKKGDEEEVYFAAKGKGKGGKGKKGSTTKPDGNAATDAANGDAAPVISDKQNIPLATLNALLEFSIPPPSSSADVHRTIDDLKTKKAWFEANQARVTAENIANAEAKVQKLMNASKDSKLDEGAADAIPPNGNGENPAEPIPTPIAPDTLSVGVEGDRIDEILEKEVEAQS